jgi:hypothetical protein
MSSHEAATHAQAGVRTRRRPDRRKGLVIDPGFQNRVRVKVMGLAIAVATTALVLTKTASYVASRPALLDNPAMPLLLAATPLLLAAAIVRACDRISNRMAGPGYRLRRTLEAVQRGERPDPVRLRKGDEFHDLADALNATLQQLGAMDPPKERDRSQG